MHADRYSFCTEEFCIYFKYIMERNKLNETKATTTKIMIVVTVVRNLPQNSVIE